MTEQTEKPVDPYQKYKDFKWENPDDFRNGPMSDETRKCRDIFCCIFFIVFLAACVAVEIQDFIMANRIIFYMLMMKMEILAEKTAKIKIIHIYIFIVLFPMLKNWKQVK